MQIREGWTIGAGSLCGAAAAIVGLLLLIGVAPDNTIDIGVGLLLAGLSRVVP